MFAGLLMAAAVPQAFGAHGLLYAGAYVLIHLGRAAVLLPALRGHPLQRRTLLVAVWFAVSAIPWLVGAFLPAEPRLVVWIVALGIDFTVAYLGWPVPKVGRVALDQLRVVGEHLAERYGQITIVALGELILVSGTTYAGGPFDVPRTVAVAVAFANAVVLWRLYFLPRRGALSRALDKRGPRLAVIAAYTHLTFVAGVVFIAFGDEVAIRAPFGGGGQRWAASLIVVGSVLILAGRIMFRAVNNVWSWGSLLGMVVILALTPALLWLPPVVALAITTLALGVVAFVPGKNDRRPVENSGASFDQ
ncbi:hypothetical protein GCM10027614_04310 [Micromonospora vulcania]